MCYKVLFLKLWFSSVQLFSRVRLCDPMNRSMPGLPVHPNPCPWMVMPSNHLILCCPFLLLPSILPSIRVFSNESAFHIRWPKYWSFSISPSNEYSRLISFKIDWLDLLAVQGNLKSLLQHQVWKHQFFGAQAFFMVQLSHPSIHDYWKNHSFDYIDLCQQSGISAF